MKDGKLVEADGTTWYFKDDFLHREDGPAYITVGGDEFYYRHGKVHRDDGPALIYKSGYQAWYKYGKRHRTDGYARTYSDGSGEFWLDNQQVSPKEFQTVQRQKMLDLWAECLK